MPDLSFLLLLAAALLGLAAAFGPEVKIRVQIWSLRRQNARLRAEADRPLPAPGPSLFPEGL